MFLSSPAVPPRRDVKVRQKQLFDIVLDTANCTSLDCLRSLPEEDLKRVNDQLINSESTGGGGNLGPVIGFGPSPDGTDIPDLPLALLREGRYHKELKGMILGSMSNEGMGISSDTDMPEAFPALVRRIMPGASNETIASIQAQYKPLEPAQLAWDWTTDAIFACNDYNLANEFSQVSKRYIMSIPPAIHGQDVYCESTNHGLILGQQLIQLSRLFL
jgi:carboxylesterase type B